jgi:hypothetical protein
MKEIATSPAKFTDISHQASLLRYPFCWYCQRAQVDESGIISTQMETAQ